jgi:hypothetical protein
LSFALETLPDSALAIVVLDAAGFLAAGVWLGASIESDGKLVSPDIHILQVTSSLLSYFLGI